MKDYRTRIYERYASGFQDLSTSFETATAERWGKAYDYYLRDWLPVERDASIVDVACGGGRLLHFFKTRGYMNLQGVDVSAEQVAIARQVVPRVTEANILDFLRMHSAEFDLITAWDIIEHLHKDEVLEFLDRCYKALRLGGRLVLQTPNAESPWGTSIRYADFTHEVCFTAAALTRLLRLCEFKNIWAREAGPVPLGYSAKSTVRFVLWRCIHQLLKAYNTIETGRSGSAIYTRVFLISALKT